MTPVPLELPLRPAEAAELSNLIFDHADGKPLSDELRSRLAARAASLKLQTLNPFLSSLERDPIHHSVYYLAADGERPLLLHLAPASAPTSSIYYKPLLIGRMRRPNGSEMVINAIPFSCNDRANVEMFAARINPCFFPQPQGARATITVEQDYPAAFNLMRAIQKRTGKNLAAFCGDSHSAMWAAIRAGWRSGYTVAATVNADADLTGLEGYSRYTVAIAPNAGGIEEGERVYQQIRNARAALKILRGFDLALDSSAPMTPEFLRSALGSMKDHGRLPQLVCPGAIAETDVEEMAATAQHFQITLSFRYHGQSCESVRAIAKAMSGRLDFRVRTVAEAEFVAENLQ